jgi:hypothetical protein
LEIYKNKLFSQTITLRSRFDKTNVTNSSSNKNTNNTKLAVHPNVMIKKNKKINKLKKKITHQWIIANRKQLFLKFHNEQKTTTTENK